MPAKIIYDMTEAAYRADPCEKPSLTQSQVKTLLDRSPAHVWQDHPRLNPNFTADEDTKFDVGNVAHRLLIGRGKNVAGLPFDNWTTKAAKEARAEHRARGILAVLQDQYDRAARMAAAALEQLAHSEFPTAFQDGHGEVVVLGEENGVHLRTMIDWLQSPKLILDYKSTAFSCSPHEIGERPSQMGWDVQAAFHERLLDMADPANAGQRRHVFVAQEDEPPHALSVVEISKDDLMLGRKKIAYAIGIWSDCLSNNHWPLYPSETVLSKPKPWTEAAWLNREIHEAGRARMPARKDFDPQTLMAG